MYGSRPYRVISVTTRTFGASLSPSLACVRANLTYGYKIRINSKVADLLCIIQVLVWHVLYGPT